MYELKNFQSNEGSGVEPAASFWRDRATYDARILREIVGPLAEAAQTSGSVPRALQRAMLERLHWYFTVDARPRAPTVAVAASLAETFHSRVAEAMRFVDAECLLELSSAAGSEARHALWSYKRPIARSIVALDAFDREQRLVRLAYWVHGTPPPERFVVDGRETAPAFAKLRACKYFRRVLFHQRIVWLPVAPQSLTLQVWLDGAPVRVVLGTSRFAVMHEAPQPDDEGLLSRVHREWPRGKGSVTTVASTPLRWRALLIKALARLPFIRRRYRDAWIFIDREHAADDNAEHLYRWMRASRPQINAWFLLQPGTRDWRRLEGEGFRLIGPGFRRRLLLLNAAHIAASQPDYAFGKFDVALYGDAMNWRFTYLKHGVMANDQSHYFANRSFDCVVAPSPAEYAALIDDETPYDLTGREVRRINLPRHDRLLQLAGELGADGANDIVVMPTWRNNLIDDRFEHLEWQDRLRRMADSEYGSAWRGLLADPMLHDLLRKAGKRLVFVPHANLIPYLAAFALPAEVTVASGDESMQPRLVRCCAFVTDYSSVAFDIALLRRAVFYFQFDRDRFYGGDHNWRPGYFDYDRDGFGPVSFALPELLLRLAEFLAKGALPERKYVARMERAMPDRTPDACKRIYDTMLELRRAHDCWSAASNERASGV